VLVFSEHILRTASEFAGMHPKKADNLRKIIKGKNLVKFKSYKKEYADGDQKRDFIYVKDVVDVLFFFLSNKDKTGIYNLGTGNAHSWNELAKAMFLAVDKQVNIQYIEMPEYLKEKYQYFTQANMDKLRNAGYEKNFLSLDDAVKDYSQYLVKGQYL
jgi:ADP-L-glycero-D-manno-heptose 6-epimerase